VKFNADDTAWCQVEWMRVNSVAKLCVNKRGTLTWDDVRNPETDWLKIFPKHSNINMQRANVSLKSYLRETNPIKDEVVLSLLNAHIGDSYHFVTTLLVYVMGIVRQLRTELQDSLIKSGIFHIAEDDWVQIHKEIHALVRVTREFNGIDLTDEEYVKLQYTNAIIGRKTYDIDVEPEILKRMVYRLEMKKSYCDGEWSTEQYLLDFEAELKLAFAGVTDGVTNLPYSDFITFLRDRYDTITKGGLTRCPKELKGPDDVIAHLAFTLKKIETMPNKRSKMEDNELLEVLLRDIFANEGYNDTGTAPKPNEAAKERVLLPGSFQHFLVVAYILGVLEKGGRVGAVMVNIDKNIADSFKHHDRRLFDTSWKFMYDFPDHNAYHSIYEMQAVMGVQGLFMQRDGSIVQAMVKWVVKSFENMTIEGTKVNSGLFTGWRCTSWINTVLNHVYMACAIRSFERKHGYFPIKDYEGTGDDVDITLVSEGDAYKLYSIMINMGYEENEIKQLVTRHNHEFMRCIYTSDSVLNCINRALPAFICGDLERTGADVAERLHSGFVNVAMLERRGLNPVVCKALERCVVGRWGRFKRDEVYKPMSPCVIHGDKRDGGMGVPDQKGRIWRLKEPVPHIDRDKVILRARKYDMTREAVKKGIRELAQLGIDAEANEEKISEMAMDSVDTASVNRALTEYMGSDEFVSFWTHKTEVIAYEERNTDKDDGELLAWLQSMGNRNIDKIYSAITRFDKLATLLPFTKVTKKRLNQILLTGQFDLHNASDLTFDQRVSVTCPEWVYSSIIRYCKYRVAIRDWDLETGRYKGECIINSYMSIYNMMM
jgi:hypothetical protein